MISALLREDLIAGRHLIIGQLVLFALYAAAVFKHTTGFYLLNIGFTLILATGPVVVEERANIHVLYRYLPVSSRDVVLARYSSGLLALLAGLVMCYGLGSLMSWAFPGTNFPDVRSPEALLAFCLVTIVTISLFFPCYFRFGLGRGVLVFFALVLVPVALVSGLLRESGVFDGAVEAIVDRGALLRPELLPAALGAWVSGYVAPIHLIIGVGIVTGGTVGLSAFLSCFFYAAREF